jgi:ABC-type nitrate/sulfonate/bicarbonate transport system substrate-binding protein
VKRSMPVFAVIGALIAAAALSGCATDKKAAASAPGQPEKLELRYQGSANAVSLPELAQDLGYFGQVKL